MNAFDEGTLDLRKLDPGQTLVISGDDGEFRFLVHRQADTGPSGILYCSDPFEPLTPQDDTTVIAQLIGTVPFSHHTKERGATLLLGTLANECGRLVAIVTRPDGEADFRTMCCSTFMVE
jgi:hypothetical protein